jgi:hypothetical protein
VGVRGALMKKFDCIIFSFDMKRCLEILFGLLYYR